MEALACEWIFEQTQRGQIQLIWSFMHDDENHLCPFLERQVEALRLAQLCIIKIGPEIPIYQMAQEFHQTAHLSSKDAVHLACAEFIQADYFITCDDLLLKSTHRLTLHSKVINPVNYFLQEENSL